MGSYERHSILSLLPLFSVYTITAYRYARLCKQLSILLKSNHFSREYPCYASFTLNIIVPTTFIHINTHLISFYSVCIFVQEKLLRKYGVSISFRKYQFDGLK